MRFSIGKRQDMFAKAADAAGSRVAHLRDTLRHAVEDGTIRFNGLGESLRGKAREADSSLRDNPYFALGAVALAGVLVGWLLRKR